jgi:hypothetical protein
MLILIVTREFEEQGVDFGIVLPATRQRFPHPNSTAMVSSAAARHAEGWQPA